MIGLFKIAEHRSKEEATSELAQWLYDYSSWFDYDTACYEDAFKTAKEIIGGFNK